MEELIERRRPSLLSHCFVVDPEKCTGCRQCEAICALDKRCGVDESRIKVFKMEELEVNIPVIAMNCDLCGGAMKCIDICATNAIMLMKIEDAAILRKRNKIKPFACPIIGAKVQAS